MGDTTTKNYKSQEDYRNPTVLDAAKTLLTAAGYKQEDIEVALDAIQTAKEVLHPRDALVIKTRFSNSSGSMGFIRQALNQCPST